VRAAPGEGARSHLVWPKSHLITVPAGSSDVSGLAWSPSGAPLALEPYKTLWILGPRDPDAIFSLKHEANTAGWDIAWSPDGTRLALITRENNAPEMWRVRDHKQIQTTTGPAPLVLLLRLPDQRMAAASWRLTRTG
jgi:hypothetical protein